MDNQLLKNIWKTALKDRTGERHITTPEIYSFILGDDILDRDAVLSHLSHCPKCLEEFNEILNAQKETEYFDIALPRMAGTKNLSGFMKIDTEGGRYTIIIHQSLKEPDKGMITVEVAQNLREKSEGAKIVLKDRKGRKLLDGTIINGQVSQKIDHLDDIDIQRFKIERR